MFHDQDRFPDYQSFTRVYVYIVTASQKRQLIMLLRISQLQMKYRLSSI